MTVDEFEEFVLLPENEDKLFEYIGGEIVEVPINLLSSIVAQCIAGEIYIYLKQNDIGYLSGESGGYQVLVNVMCQTLRFSAMPNNRK